MWIWPWSDPEVFPLVELWFPEVVGEEKQQNRGTKGTGFPQERRVLSTTPSPSSGYPLGHVASWMLPRSVQLLSPALEGFESQRTFGLYSGNSIDSPSLSRRIMAVNNRPAHSGVPLPHICR